MLLVAVFVAVVFVGSVGEVAGKSILAKEALCPAQLSLGVFKAAFWGPVEDDVVVTNRPLDGVVVREQKAGSRVSNDTLRCDA